MKPLKNKRHLARVAGLPCVVCETDEVQAHHIRLTPITGAGFKASDWLTFPLCQGCHAFLHSDIPAWEMMHGRQIDHVTMTMDEIYGGIK
jgi:hypothetical protein